MHWYIMHIFTLTSGKTLDSVKTKIKIPNKNTRTALEKKGKMEGGTEYTSIWGQTTVDIEPI